MREECGYKSRGFTLSSSIELHHHAVSLLEVNRTCCTFDDDVILPINPFIKEIDDKDLVVEQFNFTKVDFELPITIQDTQADILFEDCYFFDEVNASYAKLNGKIRFRNCKFFGKIQFENTTFEDLADFYSCDFYTPSIFYKTEFLGPAIFSAATFHKNVLFTYTLFEKAGVFRGTEFKAGLDLALAVSNNTLSFFYIRLDDFETKQEKLNSIKYQKCVSERAIVPIQNKRETFRIIKSYFESSNNHVESLVYKALEKKTLHQENKRKLKHLFTEKDKDENKVSLPKKVQQIFQTLINTVLLALSYLSNGHGQRVFQGFVFTVAVAALCFYGMLISTSAYDMAWDVDFSALPEFARFILPTHSADFMGKDFYMTYEIGKGFYIIDILGRILVGYGIYQTIQASRKFK